MKHVDKKVCVCVYSARIKLFNVYIHHIRTLHSPFIRTKVCRSHPEADCIRGARERTQHTDQLAE